MTFGLPSRSPPIQVPKVSGRASSGSSTPSRAQLVGERLERPRDGVAVQRVEVVDGVARLVDHLGARDAQLVGLPQQVDQLLQPAPDARSATRSRRRPSRHAVPLVEQAAIWRIFVSTVRRAASVGCAVKTGRSAIERRSAAPPRRRPAAAMRSTACDSHVPCCHADGRELAAAVDLLGDVGEVEVGREGAHEPRRGVGVERGQQLGGGLEVGADQPADPLEEVEQLRALLAHERAAQDVAELRDVAGQPGLRVRTHRRRLGK